MNNQPPNDTNPYFIGTDADWLPSAQKSVRLRQGDMLFQLAEDERASTAVHNLARLQRRAYAKYLGLTDEEAKESEREPDEVRLGDDDNSVKIEHYHAKAEESKNKWAPIIGAILLAAGLTGGVAVSKMLSGGPDSDTQYQLGGPWSEAPTQ